MSRGKVLTPLEVELQKLRSARFWLGFHLVSIVALAILTAHSLSREDYLAALTLGAWVVFTILRIRILLMIWKTMYSVYKKPHFFQPSEKK